MSSTRIICPFHDESTPSCVVYLDTQRYKCYGCGKHGDIKELDEDFPKWGESQKPEPMEDLAASLEYIDSLDRKDSRGLKFPSELRYKPNSCGEYVGYVSAYYIVWPNKDYYLKRNNEDGSKYIGPKGHRRPLFGPFGTGDGTTLIIVEGEMNALSIHKMVPNVTVVSPGSATELGSDKVLSINLKSYSRIIIAADNDAAGLEGALKLRGKLLSINPYVEVKLMEEDANDILCKGVGANDLCKKVLGL